MTYPQLERPDLPEFLTWEELERLPEEVAGEIELWEGRVVWVRRGPMGHQRFTRRLTNALEVAANKAMSEQPQQCWNPESETNVFLGRSGKSDFLTPDFLVCRCLEPPDRDVRATDVVLVGEVLSPSNTLPSLEAKKARYAGAGIPWYWEVELAPASRAITAVRAFVLETGSGRLPAGVRPLRPANYVVGGEWTRDDPDGIAIDFPFPIRIPWSELEF